MATYFSDHFSGVNEDTLEPDNSVLDLTKFPEPGSHRSRLRYKRAEITRDFGSSDVLRMMHFKSGDRINAIFVTATDSGSTGQFGIGLYETGRDHDGTQIDENLFRSAMVTTTAINHVDQFMNPGHPDSDLLRGKPLWVVADAGDGDYSVDPMEDWDLVLYCSYLFTEDTTFILEAYYTSGD